MSRKTVYGLLTVAALLYLFAFVFILRPAQSSDSWLEFRPTKIQQSWRTFDEETACPEWERFQKDHPKYDYWETEIYRGGKRSVNRFYKAR